MAFNSAPHRKAKPTRLKNPLVIPTYQQQGTDCGLPKEKVPKRGTRNGALSKAQAPEPTSKDTIHDMTRISNHIGLAQASKNPIRAAGGGNAQVAPKYQSTGNVGSQPLNTVRSSVPRTSHPKPTPKEIRDCKETKELVFKELKEIRAPKEPKSFRHFKEPKDQKEPKEPKEPMESKDQKARGADKSPNITHRTARHNTNRTKNYFDKYLKFAFDLSTPEGVQKLEAHFFPDQDPTASGSSNVNREE